jgi:PBP1b-binding outer membrane lipoprotein LpoB
MLREVIAMKHKLSIVLLLCVLSLMMSGCASHQIAPQGKKVESQEEKIESLIMLLGDEDIATCRNAAKELAYIGEPAIPTLIEALSHQESRIRGNATLVLGWIGQPASDAVPNLTQALSDAHEKVRRNATFALGEIAVITQAEIVANMGTDFRRGCLSLGVPLSISVGSLLGLAVNVAGCFAECEEGWDTETFLKVAIPITVAGTVVSYFRGNELDRQWAISRLKAKRRQQKKKVLMLDEEEKRRDFYTRLFQVKF